MPNRNFNRGIGVRRTGKFLPKQTKSQMNRENRMHQLAVQNAIFKQDHHTDFSFSPKALDSALDDAMLALVAGVVSRRRR